MERLQASAECGEAFGFRPGGGAGDGISEIVFSFGHADMMHEVTDISGTRSSHRWMVPPYNHDRLHGDMIFLSENRWGLPDLPAVDCVPVRLIAFSDSRGSPEPGAVHFFLDDYRFETAWTSPFRSLARLQRLGKEVRVRIISVRRSRSKEVAIYEDHDR